MFQVKVNGEIKQVDADAETPLLWAIREELKYTGTKFGCGKGLCGACTVHLNGSPTRSCQVPLSVASADGIEVTTIEGIGTKEQMHPVQQAWNELNVPQCGYCQSGQIMSAVALLAQNKNPSDKDIFDAMSGNLCRCGTYPRIKSAIKLAATKLQNHPMK